MNVMEFILEKDLILDAVEFGTASEFILISRRKGQRKHRTNRLTTGQMRLLFAAMSEQGKLLQDAIDYLYEKHRNDYDLLFRGKRLRIEFRKLFGRPCNLSGSTDLPTAA